MNGAAGALAYYGGKHPTGTLCHWISSMIGPTPDGFAYCEPFGGMFGVGLSRPPPKLEILNDANRWIYTWWLAVRDHNAAFVELIRRTPHSRAAFADAVASIKGRPSGDVLTDALTCHIVIDQSMRHGTESNASNWQIAYGNVGKFPTRVEHRIEALADRLRDVQLECRDATAILRRTAGERGMLLYVDPPYRTADTSPYGDVAKEIDWQELGVLLAAQAGMVAISGYRDEWDGIGFRRHELDHFHRRLGWASKGKREPRTEVLWTNFDAKERIGGLFA